MEPIVVEITPTKKNDAPVHFSFDEYVHASNEKPTVVTILYGASFEKYRDYVSNFFFNVMLM